jgi:hypothetical protein
MIPTRIHADPESWHDGAMPKRSSPKRDFHGNRPRHCRASHREPMDGSPLPEPEPDARNPHAVALGEHGRSQGWAF